MSIRDPCTTKAEQYRRQAGARGRGERLFYGMPCARCPEDAPGDGLRRSSNGYCVHCARRYGVAYARRWRVANPVAAAAKLRRHLIRLGSRRQGPMV